MQKSKLIVFDIDGTLTNSVAPHQKAFVEALKELGVQHIDTNFKAYKHHTDSFIAKSIYEQDRNKPFTNDVLEHFEWLLTDKLFESDIEEIKGAAELVRHIEDDTCYGVCYATGSLIQPAEYKLKSVGIDFQEELIVASNKLHEREQIVAQAIDNAKNYYDVSQFDNIISIGDGLWDWITAQNLGLDFIGIGEVNKTVLLDNGAMHHFTDLTNCRHMFA